ncbi:peptidoglycan-binding protein [Tissierella sp. Yu-01]|uniref:C40 family peptidase n=1 Tax=Tissierella sp. Yu-01 TaxID=3035694 RepID=UPI00240E2243|nr:peptidoglycan-binding protein [Tissierella sp. Yu-01]WFA10234.1 NlpC/P60 family protein [Tissierella sp. Yu-01]
MQKRKALKGTTLALALSGILTFASSPTYAVLGDQVLKEGMEHPDVQVLQEELKNLGLYNSEKTSTYYDELTAQSVRAFQISKGIEINGIFDLNTHEILMASKGSVPTVKNEVAELNPEVQNKGSNLTFNRELNLKDEGEDVRQLQEALKAMGYLAIDDCTDYFGNQTESALTAFQEDQGLVPDGIAGLRTIEAINKVLSGRGIALPEVSRGSELGSLANNIIVTAKKYLGVRYSYGGSSPNGFDCSGFTSYVYKQHGITLPRATTGQATFGTKVSKADLRTGDLVIFSNTYKSGPSHAGIYIDNGKFIHASSVGSGGVIISDLNSNYYSSHFSYGRRVF